MPNTDRFQRLPDFFSSKEEGKKAIRENTNPRYKFFKQSHFTAGDYEQFMTYWDRSNHIREISPRRSDWIPPQVDCPLYRGISTDDVIHTFEYIFHKFKKGIFVKIVSNELRVFLPFSKIDYVNEWSDRVRIDPARGVENLLERSARQSGHRFDPGRVHFMMDNWYANNGLLRYEYPISENDSGVGTLRDMLMCLTKERDVPDIEFFLNKRDFPILRGDRKEAYECIFGDDHPLVSHDYPSYCPILGMTTTEKHADIPIPTWDDWARVSFPHKMFGKDFMEYPDPFVADYPSKKDTAVFRGSSTGLGTTPETNPRLRYALLSMEGRRDDDGKILLDCGITKWNSRPRRPDASMCYDCISDDLIEKIPLVSPMTYREQASHKFIIHLPGHSEAYRLAMELGMGSVLLLYPCRYKMWFSAYLKPFVHYVPIGDNDIFDKIRWCKTHPVECEIIAGNARRFYETMLSRDAILDYLHDLLCNIQERTGLLRFPRKNMTDFQYEMETNHIMLETQILRTIKSFPSVDTNKDMSGMNPRTFQIVLHRMDPAEILKKISDAPIIKQSRSMSLRKIVIAGRTLCVKTPVTPCDAHLAHECFIGQMGLNRVANTLPMVAYMYGRWENNILCDFVEGETLEASLRSQKTEKVVGFLLSILQQLSLLLQFLQTELGFIHYDMYPWNVMICRNTHRRSFSLPVGAERSIRFVPEYYPVLIDFGKSHLVYQNIHFVNVAPFHMHLHQDIISILVSGLHILIRDHKLCRDDIGRVMRLMNYVTGTSYTGFKRFDNMSQVKSFLRLKKKYSNMLLDDKPEFRDVEPLAFFEYTRTHKLNGISFKMLDEDDDLLINMEVSFSRFACIRDICNILSIPKTVCDPVAIFLRDRSPLTRHSCSNPINTLFRLYIDYQMMKTCFKGHGEDVLKERIVAFIERSHSYTLRYEPIAITPIALPRFFSHPDIVAIDVMDITHNTNHFFERHKILMILHHALNGGEFAGMERVFGGDTSIRYYMSSILDKNRPASISNHLRRYREWLV